jgi:hypothetical protein
MLAGEPFGCVIPADATVRPTTPVTRLIDTTKALTTAGTEASEDDRRLDTVKPRQATIHDGPCGVQRNATYQEVEQITHACDADA